MTPLSGNQDAVYIDDKKHLKNVGPIRHCELPHALILHCHSPGVATVTRRLRINVHDDDDDNNDNTWQRGPLWPHGIGPIMGTYKSILGQSRPLFILSKDVGPYSNQHVSLWQMPNMSHVVNSCSQTKLESGLQQLHSADDVATV